LEKLPQLEEYESFIVSDREGYLYNLDRDRMMEEITSNIPFGYAKSVEELSAEIKALREEINMIKVERTGTVTINPENQVSVYPNPTNDLIK